MCETAECKFHHCENVVLARKTGTNSGTVQYWPYPWSVEIDVAHKWLDFRQSSVRLAGPNLLLKALQRLSQEIEARFVFLNADIQDLELICLFAWYLGSLIPLYQAFSLSTRFTRVRLPIRFTFPVKGKATKMRARINVFCYQLSPRNSFLTFAQVPIFSLQQTW